MRVYARSEVCGFRYSAAAWGEFSNFFPLTVSIAAGPWRMSTAEHLYQAAKFPGRPDVQQRIAETPTAREAAAVGRTPGLGIDPAWHARRIDVMRWVLRMKREANMRLQSTRSSPRPETGRLSRSRRAIPGGARGPSPIATKAEMSSAGSGWSCASSSTTAIPAACSTVWLARIRVGRLAERPGASGAAREAA